MPRFLSSLSLITVLMIGTALSAQEATTGATETEAATETGTTAQTDTTQAEQGVETQNDAQADEATDLEMGQDVVESPTYFKDTYGDWQLKCFRSEGQEDLCQMYQLLREGGGNPVAEFSIYQLPEGQQAVAGATIIVPLGTLLSKEMRISVDGGKAKTYPYSFCTAVGCFARIGLTQADVDAFKRGVEATLTIIPAQAPDQVVGIKASLKGFTAAFENSSTIQQ